MEEFIVKEVGVEECRESINESGGKNFKNMNQERRG